MGRVFRRSLMDNSNGCPFTRRRCFHSTDIGNSELTFRPTILSRSMCFNCVPKLLVGCPREIFHPGNGERFFSWPPLQASREHGDDVTVLVPAKFRAWHMP